MVKTKKKSKSRKKSTKKLVHQIYGIFDDGIPLKDIDVFYENVMKTTKFCKKKGYEYKMWDLKKCNSLINKYFSEYSILWDKSSIILSRNSAKNLVK